MIEDDDIVWQSEEMTVFAREMKVVGVMPPLPFYYEIAEKDGGFFYDRIVVSEETLKEFCKYFVGLEQETRQ